MEINALTPAERRVRRAFATGTTVDFREAPDEAVRPDWGRERTVRSRVLRELLLNGPHRPGEVPALKLMGARITGELDLRYATVDSVVRLGHCHFDTVPRLAGAHLNYLNLRDSVLPGLAAARSRIGGSLRLTGCRFGGPVHLGGAQISGALFLERAELGGADPTSAVLGLNQVTIDDDLCARGLRAHGVIRLDGATVAGSIDLEGAELNNPGGFVLEAEALDVGANLLGRRMRADGRIDLRGSRIPGRVDLLGTSLSNPGGTALRASSCVIGEIWLREGPPVKGRLNLRRAEVGQLQLEPEMLPDQVRLLDLTYTFLTPHEPAERRLPMLERDDGAFDPHAYEQLTAAYRRIGDDRGARVVQLAKQRRHRRTLPWYGRAWGRLQDAAVGYGFRPLRAAGWLLSLLAVGSIAYAGHHPPPLKAGEAPPFNPVFYTLDLMLPVISFGQEGAYAPAGAYQWLAYVLIVTGWILATTVVAGVTRTVSRQ
ncbi:membrane-associated oxidoreductase [Streptomyces sp. ID05-04B]|uniref:membrane-associated oxidoreductase n=1 Tax=unclassified Streptomyces TaxID=2593676 RepID=UPI000D1A7FC6|nr:MULTISPECIES: membrane-associated oxidoreductase [unclassified Streptomyces]AVV45589.1 membrane-associated oxidoreductase [Streptomyces sp. P3]MDX5567213.1 membrane-associated oxidoreductase [Streptomyces sp. ID05-04B]